MIAVAATVSLIAACSSSDDDADDSDDTEEPAATTGDDSVPAEEPAEEPGEEPAADGNPDDGSSGDGDGGLTIDDVGTAVVRIDGSEFGGFEGDCDISRGAGGEDVGELSTPGLSIIVAIDNVDSQPVEELNFVMIDEESFRVRNVGGTIGSITESGPRATSGSQQFVPVVFAGMLDDGRSVEAEVVCQLQNAF